MHTVLRGLAGVLSFQIPSILVLSLSLSLPTYRIFLTFDRVYFIKL